MPTPDEYIKSLETDPKQRPGQPQPPKPPKHLVRKIIRGIIVVFSVTVVLAVIYLAFLMSKLSANPFDFGPLAGSDSGRVNVLVLGIGDPGHAGEKLSDSMMVMSINTQTKQVAMISLPRDMRVDIPGYYTTKINAANALGGPTLAAQTVSNTLAIPINYYLETNFSGLKQAVDSVGGIDITVKDRLYDPEYPCADNEYKVCGLDIKPGNYHMNGALALQYARCRKGTCGNDFGRAERQQEVIQAVEAKALNVSLLWHPWRLTNLEAAFRTNITTNLSTSGLIQVFNYLHQPHQTINAVFSTSPGGMLKGSGSSDLVPIGGDYTQIQTYVQNVFTLPPPPTPNQ